MPPRIMGANNYFSRSTFLFLSGHIVSNNYRNEDNETLENYFFDTYSFILRLLQQ